MCVIGFVIPCYNSEKTVASVIDGIKEKVAERPEYRYEVIAINDCSPDGVIHVLNEIALSDPDIKVIDLAKNSGKHTAILVGYKFAKGKYVVSLDDDGQCPIERLWDLIAPLEEGHDMSMAKRYFLKLDSSTQDMYRSSLPLYNLIKNNF